MALSQLQPPPYFDIHERNAADLWRDWKNRWKCYSIATELSEKKPEVQVSVLLTVIGPEAHKVFSTFKLTEDKKKDINSVLQAFEDYCQPLKNTAFERYKFNLRGQLPSESFEQYVTELRKLALKCDFDNITPEQILRDRIIFGIHDNKVRDRLLREKNITLDQTLEICRASEVSRAQQREAEELTGGRSVHAFSMKEQTSGTFKQVVKNKGDKLPTDSAWITDCRFCGKAHTMQREKCPAWGKACSNCKGQNHFRAKCRNLKKTYTRSGTHGINNVRENYDVEDGDSEVYTVRTVSSVRLKEEQTVTLKTGPKCYIKFQIDSGADCNVLPLHIYTAALKDFKLQKVQHSSTVMYGYGQKGNHSKGRVRIHVERGDRSCDLDCELLEGRQYHSILGYKACVSLGLLEIKDNDKLRPMKPCTGANVFSAQTGSEILTKESIFNKYPKVFREAVGELAAQCKIRVDESVSPVQHAPRRVPAALRSRLIDELNGLEASGIIAKVEVPTDWVSSVVVVPKKNGKLRICLDPKDLNKAIKREHYPLPVIEDIATRLCGARVFTILDVRQGFWHIPLEDRSTYLTTFNTPFGRYRWLRMPFGICSAPEIFQRHMHQLIEGLAGVEVVADDFVVYGCGTTNYEAMRDHDKKLQEFLQRCEERNVVLGKEKLQFKLNSVPFVGHIITPEGLKPAPNKIKAVTEMPAPTDVASVRRFLGMIQYLSKFLPGLADMTKPLRELTKKDILFEWQEAQQNSFEELKKAVSDAPVLRYYDMKQDVTIQCDASQSGLGAVLMQNGQPVCYASRALTSTEQRYAQIEKECLAIVFACERFHQYIYGRESILIHTDHQPLESIFRKSLVTAPARLQRMLLRLQYYNLKVEYKQGKTMVLADTLSRAYLSEDNDSSFINILQEVRYQDTLMVSEERIQEIKKHVEMDDGLQELYAVIMEGWPDTRKEVPVSARPYFNYRDELHAEDGLLFKGNRLVVPSSLRKEMLAIAHQGHIGLEGCLRRMREAIFWPGMSSDMKALVSQCDACLRERETPNKEPLMSHEFQLRPWSKVGADICHFDNRDLLVVVDYYSNYIEVARLRNMSSKAVIREIQDIFSRHGIPDTLVTDNGPQFTTVEFKTFSHHWSFKHVTSSPRYPQSNGKAENAVKTVKRLFAKCKSSGHSEFQALLNWRNTPGEGMHSSPAQRLMGRRCKTLLPSTASLLHPRYSMEQDHWDIAQSKAKQSQYYNRSSRPLSQIYPGDAIRMKVPGSEVWTPGECIKEVSPRSYIVRIGERQYRRNRRQLLHTGERLREDHWEDEKQGEDSYVTKDLDEEERRELNAPESDGQDVTAGPTAGPTEGICSPHPVLRRSTRIRKPPVRYGIDC